VPSADPDTVARLQQETAEACSLLAQGLDLDASPITDLSSHLTRAQRGGVLTATDLLAIAHALTGVRQVKTTLLRQREACPTLARIAEAIPDLKPLEERLLSALTPQGQISDDASPTLRALRAEARQAYQAVEEALGRIVHSPLGRHILQEPLITQRAGRPVLPLKAEFRGRLPGLVHDVSESGATLFVEPLPIVPLTNRWRERQTAAEREEERILRSLSHEVGTQAEDIARALEASARIDLAFAKGRWARHRGAIRPAIAAGPRPMLRLVDARHPLLPNPVPNTIEVGEQWSILLITGPNAGGKTVALKTAGLLALLHQCGIPIPAGEGSVLSVFDRIYADIGDQQSIERSLSTFSAHLTAVREALEGATSRSLVLLDELGASTDPEEGSALAKALLVEFQRRAILLIATTHQREVAAFAQEQPGMMNASLDLDPTTLAPTYRLTLGVPGRSWGLTIARRLGLPESILQRAQAFLSPERRRLEALLAQMEQERRSLRRRQQEVEMALTQANALRQRLQEELARLEQDKARILEDTRRQVQQEAQALLTALQEARRTLKTQETSALRQAIQRVQAVRRELRAERWQSPQRRAFLAALRPGLQVWVRGFPQPGTVLTPPDAQGDLEVQVGSLRLRTSVDALERHAEEVPLPPSLTRRMHASTAPPSAPAPPSPALPTAEVDLRGLRTEEALRRLDAFLDKAVLEGHRLVRVVHGAGTGALRTAVREHLKTHPLSASWKPDTTRPNDGATLVELA
ncbi:MAG: Smr/MutS family protein, partial [Dehalococcoidia bacterium]|nr:Smr/MutS family protein [Dehalococcoidia bacterium]